MPVSTDISHWIQRLQANPLPARRTSPDLLQQLMQTLKRPVDRVLVIAADADDGLDLLARVVREQRDDYQAGLDLLDALVPARRAIVDPRTARRFGAYPVLEPPLLIRRFFNRRMRFGVASTEVGVLVIDTITLVQLGMMMRDEPVRTLPVVVDDHFRTQRIRFDAPIDATVDAVIRQAKLNPEAPTRYTHGPAMQKRAVDPLAPIATTELWLHAWPCEPPEVATACTRCGECAVACPVRLQPSALLEAASQGDRAAGDRFHLQSCIECGICDVVCPSRLPILTAIRSLKKVPA
jgi:electron transport complex protein RnfC